MAPMLGYMKTSDTLSHGTYAPSRFTAVANIDPQWDRNGAGVVGNLGSTEAEGDVMAKTVVPCIFSQHQPKPNPARSPNGLYTHSWTRRTAKLSFPPSPS